MANRIPVVVAAGELQQLQTADTLVDPSGNPLGSSFVRGARVYNNVAISIPNAAATVLTMNSERWDTDNIHTNSFPSRLTCTVAGKYLIGGHLSFVANGTGSRQIAILLNGTTSIAENFTGSPSSVDQTDMSIATVWDLAVGDYVELRAFQSSTAALNVNASNPSHAYSPEFFMVQIAGSSAGGVKTAALDFTDGDTLKRFVIADTSIQTQTGFAFLTVQRPTTLESADPVYFYQAQLISVTPGVGFEVLVGVTDGDGGDVTDQPPNETVTLSYAQNVPVGSSSSSSSVSVVDTAPSSPSIYDDEFNGSSLDAKWTWVNQGTSTASVSKGSLVLTPQINATTFESLLVQAIPGVAWTLLAKITLTGNLGNFLSAGIAVRDSTSGKHINFGINWNNGWKLMVNRYTTTTSFSATPAAVTVQNQTHYLRIQDDGTNLKYSHSVDGIGFVQLLSELRTAFLTPSHFGIAVETSANAMLLGCDWFRVTTP